MFGPAEMNDTLSSKITWKKTMAYNLLRSMEIFGFAFDTLHNANLYQNNPSIVLELTFFIFY